MQTAIRRNSKAEQAVWANAVACKCYCLDNGFVGEDATVEVAHDLYSACHHADLRANSTTPAW